MRSETGGETQARETLTTESGSSTKISFRRRPLDTPVRRVADRNIFVIFGAGAINRLLKSSKSSGLAGVFGLRDSSIRKKIIGHTVKCRATRFALGKQLGPVRRVLTFFKQKTGEGCVRVVIHPLINQSGYFLADIGGVRKTR